MSSDKLIGHISAFVTIFIWSVAFIGNKVLLGYLSPIDIMIFRFSLAYFLLLLLYPKSLLPHSYRDELFFFLLGFLGIFIYFLLENFALKYTQVANVGLYMGAIPIFTAIFSHFFVPSESLNRNVWLGFVISMAGMSMILFEGRDVEFRLLGDSLALMAAIVFALYSGLLKLAPKQYNYIVVTRKSFFYALLMMIAYSVGIDGTLPNVLALSKNIVWVNVFFLGVLSSGLAFILWNYSVKTIGPVQTSNYIYLVPVITATSGVLILDEKLTIVTVLAGVLILAGLYISQRRNLS